MLLKINTFSFQVLRAVPLADKNVFVTKIAYSPLVSALMFFLYLSQLHSIIFHDFIEQFKKLLNLISKTFQIGGYAVVLNDGRAALLVASSPSFDPNVSQKESFCIYNRHNFSFSFIFLVCHWYLGSAIGRCQLDRPQP